MVLVSKCVKTRVRGLGVAGKKRFDGPYKLTGPSWRGLYGSRRGRGCLRKASTRRQGLLQDSLSTFDMDDWILNGRTSETYDLLVEDSRSEGSKVLVSSVSRICIDHGLLCVLFGVVCNICESETSLEFKSSEVWSLP